MIHFARAFSFAVLTAVGAFAGGVSAQCNLQWQAGTGLPGVGPFGVLAGIPWDPDGPGPGPTKLLVAGDFGAYSGPGMAGEAIASGVAVWDPTTNEWSAMGNFTGPVRTLLETSNGELYAAGGTNFGQAAVQVYRWNGTQWLVFTTVFGHVNTMAELPNGDLVVGGVFSNVGGTAAGNLARLDASGWHAFGQGVTGAVTSLTTTPAGDLVVGGIFSAVDGQAASNIARWDGNAWHAMGGGVDGSVYSLAQHSNGSLLVGGDFVTAGGVPSANVALWDGAAWTSFGSGLPAAVYAVIEDPSLGIVAAGSMGQQQHIVRWTGTSWQPLAGGTNGWVRMMCKLPGHGLVAGGSFQLAGAVGVTNVARFDNNAWHVLGAGSNGRIECFHRDEDGEVFAGGEFTSLEGNTVRAVARRVAGGWAPLGAGIVGTVRALARIPDGDLVAGGVFLQAGGVLASNVARWDGSAWSACGAGFPGPVNDMAVLPNGDLIAAGFVQTSPNVWGPLLQRWDGSAWSPMIAPPIQVYDLATSPNGVLLAAGQPAPGGVGVVFFDGVNWMPLPSTISQGVAAMAFLPNGDLVTAAGQAPRFRRWDGSLWHTIGPVVGGPTGGVSALAVLPNGDLIVGGGFTTIHPSVASQRLARWDGQAWQPFPIGPSDGVTAIQVLPEGELLVGGYFLRVGASASAYLATLRTPCPATAQVFGAPCVNPNGLTELRAASLPWLGSEFVGEVAGLPNTSFAVAVYGFQGGALSLHSSPFHAPGCFLYSSVEFVQLVPVSAGMARASLSVPDSLALLGQTLRQQVLVVSPNNSPIPTTLASSNALILTLGSL